MCKIGIVSLRLRSMELWLLHALPLEADLSSFENWDLVIIWDLSFDICDLAVINGVFFAPELHSLAYFLCIMVRFFIFSLDKFQFICIICKL
jgi:hypothetical protein